MTVPGSGCIPRQIVTVLKFPHINTVMLLHKSAQDRGHRIAARGGIDAFSAQTFFQGDRFTLSRERTFVIDLTMTTHGTKVSHETRVLLSCLAAL